MTELPFFPNVPTASLELEGRLRLIAKDMPERTRADLYEVLSVAHPAFVPTSFFLEDETIVVIQNDCRIAFPRPLPMVKHSHAICGYEEWLAHKYALPGFVYVEPGDLVIDCGAYVGGFSLSAVKKAKEVHAFEPEIGNFRCLSRNLGSHSNIRLNDVGLYSHTRKMLLNISASSVEHSLLTPDDGATIESREIEVVSLRDYCAANAIESIDFLKLEAEGVELEIFEGLGDLKPRKVAIDVSPEREGESPANAFKAILAPLGYEIAQRGHVLFGSRS